MNCLCCGKPIEQDNENGGWHQTCIKNFFGTSVIPKIDIDENTLELLASESIDRGFTIPGVQKKLSLHLFSDGKNPRLTLVNFPNGYILKPQVNEFNALPESEHLAMCMADKAGISTVPHALIMKKENAAYITRRIDRIFEGEDVRMLAMEDFCQLDLRLTQDKYKGSYERCASIINKYSSRKIHDLSELYTRLVFSFMIGNSDMHLKNFSLIETEENSGQYTLSPAYDMLPVNVIMPEDTEQTALALNGKKNNIRKKDFIVFAEKCELSREQAEEIILNIVSMKDVFIKMCEDSLLPNEMKEGFIRLIENRCSVFNG